MTDSGVPARNSFASDNVSGACAEVLEAVLKANEGIAPSYADDAYSRRLDAAYSELFETEVRVFPVVSGTAANALALAAITPRHGKIFCHAMSHINTDECGAPEFFTGGAKLVPIAGVDGKITAEALIDLIRGAGNVHSAQPAAVSFAQSCETGVVYQLEEMAALCEAAHARDLCVHMDGARFANALVTLEATPAQMSWQAGVDVLSFGGTKNGCLAAEAVVFFRPELIQSFPFIHKRSGHLLSKMRFVSAQLLAYIANDVWLRNARHANAMAQRLSAGLAAIETVDFAFPVQANELFVNLQDDTIERLNNAGFIVADGELDESAPPRFVTAWNSTPEDVDELIAAVQSAIEG